MSKSRPPAFVEQSPIVLEGHVRPTAPVATNEHRKTVAAAREQRRLNALPVHGAGQIELSVVGSRVTLAPTDREAAVLLNAAKAVHGREFDQKRMTHVSSIDDLRRRAAGGFDSVDLFARLFGLPVSVDAGVESAVERARALIDRQLAPIPRTIWVDESGVEHEVVAERELGRPRL